MVCFLERILLVCSLIILPVLTQSKTVLIFPAPSTSHTRYYANIGKALVEIGHEVWVCVPDFLVRKGHMNTEGIKLLRYGEELGDIEQKILHGKKVVNDFWDGKTMSMFDVGSIGDVMKEVTEDIMSSKKFLSKISELQPDLFILDGVPFIRNMLALPYKLDIPFAIIGSVHDVVLARIPFSPATMPVSTWDMNDQMNFWERLQSLTMYVLTMMHDPFSDDSIVSRIAPEKPYKSIADIAMGAELYLAETDHILDYPKPTLPNTMLIGSTVIAEPKSLKEPFKSFMDQSTTGVIIVSFGSTVTNIPEKITHKMIKAFKEMSYKVVWKVNISSPDSKQILTSTWLPQNDLMGHKNTKLFISHCSKNSQYEALYNAVPMLCLPMFGDQFYNANRIQTKYLGLKSDLRKISAEKFTSLIEKIVQNKTYQENIEKASMLYKEFYKTPKETAAFWLDHVMRFGGAYLRSAGQQNMPLYQFLLLDVLAVLVVLIVTISYLVYRLFACCYRACAGRRRVNRT